jgi:S-adenosylmethionine:tRNA ribosyltransferase-isomerase
MRRDEGREMSYKGHRTDERGLAIGPASTDLLDLDRRSYLFELPAERIAQEPPEAAGRARSDVRLLVAHRDQERVEHRRFVELTDYLRRNDVFVVNNARVVPSVLHGSDQDGRDVVVQIFSPMDDATWHCMVLPAASCRQGATFNFGDGELTGTLLHEEEDHIWRLAIQPADMKVLERVAEYFYPWYLKIAPAHPDYYQTAYASSGGATGLPSAGRHLTPTILAAMSELGVAFVQVTLDIAVRWTYEGFCSSFSDLASTIDTSPYMFQALYGPPRPERYHVPLEVADTINKCRRNGGRIVACGTSALRTLETVTDDTGHVYPGSGWTAILISPGHEFRACDVFLTNFHMPMSSELILTAAVLGGRKKILDIYRHEVLPRDYAFHEFGDSMLITGDRRRITPRTPAKVPDPTGNDPRHSLAGG